MYCPDQHLKILRHNLVSQLKQPRRDEAGSCDQRAKHATPQTDHQEEVTETTNVEKHVLRSVEPYVTKRGRTVRPPEKLDL